MRVGRGAAGGLLRVDGGPLCASARARPGASAGGPARVARARAGARRPRGAAHRRGGGPLRRAHGDAAARHRAVDGARADRRRPARRAAAGGLVRRDAVAGRAARREPPAPAPHPARGAGPRVDRRGRAGRAGAADPPLDHRADAVAERARPPRSVAQPARSAADQRAAAPALDRQPDAAGRCRGRARRRGEAAGGRRRDDGRLSAARRGARRRRRGPVRRLPAPDPPLRRAAVRRQRRRRADRGRPADRRAGDAGLRSAVGSRAARRLRRRPPAGARGRGRRRGAGRRDLRARPTGDGGRPPGQGAGLLRRGLRPGSHRPRLRAWRAWAWFCSVEPWDGKGRNAAHEALRAAIAEDPADADGHALLGQLYVAVGRWNRADACFAEALDRDPRHAEALRGRQAVDRARRAGLEHPEEQDGVR